MVEASLAASAVISGLILLGIVAALTLSRRRHPTLLGQDAAGSGFISQRYEPKSWAASTDALFVSFALLTVGAFGAVIFYVQGGGFADPLAMAAAAAAGLGLLLGSYSLGENAGIGSAGAMFVTATLVGLLLVAVIGGNLVTGA
jgi:hypothetical protein